MAYLTIKVNLDDNLLSSHQNSVENIIAERLDEITDLEVSSMELLRGGKDIPKLIPNFKQLMERENTRALKKLKRIVTESIEESMDDFMDYDEFCDATDESPVIRIMTNKIKNSKEFKRKVREYVDDEKSIRLAKVEKDAQALGYELVKR